MHIPYTQPSGLGWGLATNFFKGRMLFAAHLKHFKANAAYTNWLIDIEFQNWDVVVWALAAQNSPTMAAVVFKRKEWKKKYYKNHSNESM